MGIKILCLIEQLARCVNEIKSSMHDIAIRHLSLVNDIIDRLEVTGHPDQANVVRVVGKPIRRAWVDAVQQQIRRMPSPAGPAAALQRAG